MKALSEDGAIQIDAVASHGAQARMEWVQGWPLVLTSTAGMVVASSYVYSLGVFIQPVQQEFGWARRDIAIGLTIVSVMSMFSGPVVGYLVDRFGARRVGIPGVLFYCAAFASLAMTMGSVWAWWGGWFLVALGAVCIKPTVWTAAVAARFDAERGLALAVTMCGLGLGAAFIPFLSELAVRTFGWRTAYVLIGGTAALLVTPLMLLFFFDARDRTPRTPPPGGSVRHFPELRDLVSSRFIRLALSGFLVTAAMTTITINFVPVMSSLGMTRSAAAAVAGIIGIASITGRIGAGFLLDRIDGRIVGVVSYATPIAACFYLLVFDGSLVGAMAVAVILGLSVGAEIDVLAYLTSRYFGMKTYGIMFGTCVGLVSLGAGLGTLMGNVVYDLTGSYRGAIMSAIPVFMLATLLVGTLDRYALPRRARVKGASAP